MAKTLTLIRHGSIDANERNLLVGATDSSLNQRGKIEAVNVAEMLQKRRFHCIYCSPLLRCRQTADEIASKLDLEPLIDDDLREIDFGDWEGKSIEHIKQNNPAALDRWVNDFSGFAIPGGDSVKAFQKRIDAFLTKILYAQDVRAMAVTHGGVISAIICKLLKIRPEAYLAFKIKPACVVSFHIHDTAGVLTELNNSVNNNSVGEAC